MYNCTISHVIDGADTETAIPCSTSNTPLTHLVWRFNRSQLILTKSRAEDVYTPSERWRQHVKTVSETGGLTLRDLSSDQTGTYTCELGDDEETNIKHTFVHVPGKKVSLWSHSQSL